MKTLFEVKQEVHILFNNTPVKKIIQKIEIDGDGTKYWFSGPFEKGKEASSGLCEDFYRHESSVASSKEELARKIFG